MQPAQMYLKRGIYVSTHRDDTSRTPPELERHEERNGVETAALLALLEEALSLIEAVVSQLEAVASTLPM